MDFMNLTKRESQVKGVTSKRNKELAEKGNL